MKKTSCNYTILDSEGEKICFRNEEAPGYCDVDTCPLNIKGVILSD